MANLSFEIKSTKDLYLKLIEEHEEFDKDDTSSRIAINCAMTAWHLTDWCYYEHEQQLMKIHKSLPLFQAYVKQLHTGLQIMHDIANGSKHLKLTRHTPKVKETKLHEGAFSSAFSSAFDISSLVVEMNDGRKLYFGNIIVDVIDFWRHYLKNEHGISI